MNLSEIDLLDSVSTRLALDRRSKALGYAQARTYGDADLTVVIGMDAEWVSKGALNTILSYQSFCARMGDNTGGYSGFVLPPTDKRLRLDHFIRDVIQEGLKQGYLAFWPKSIVLVSHFSLGDLNAFCDFGRFKTRLDSIRRTFATLTRPMVFHVWDSSRHKHRLSVVLRDTLLLAPSKQHSLKVIGDLVGIPKVEIPDAMLARMDVLLRDDPKKFEEYARIDPKICVRYAQRIAQLFHELTGDRSVPPTLSSIGERLLLDSWKQTDTDKLKVLGTEVLVEKTWDPAKNRTGKCRSEKPTATRYHFDSFATECYHGGRNEPFFFGASNRGEWLDWDLAGAYTTAMAEIGMPDWENIRQTNDLEEFQPHTMGFARVRFEFPANTRFPCLPVRTADCLLFPLYGEAYCAAPEIYLAKRLAARLEIVNGVIVPCSFNHRPFEPFIIDCARRRREFLKDSLEEQFWKEIGNGTYGKVAQGLRNKRAFNSRSDSYVDLPPSKITNPYFAAYVTSFVRAVIVEILSRLPLTSSVCNVTTDGFLSDAKQEDVESASMGPLCRQFAQARLRVSGNQEILEIKHRARQVLGWRTRGQATLEAEGEAEIILAKAGTKLPISDKETQNSQIIELFVTRTPESVIESTQLRTLPEIFRKGGDLTNKKRTARLSMEFDFKREPARGSEQSREINGMPHLYFDTVPWRTVEDFTKCRENAEAYRKSAVLKTEEDFRDFDEYCALRDSPSKVRTAPGKRAYDLAKRMVLRAYVRGLAGFTDKSLSYSEFAQYLTDAGYPTRKSDLENAARPASVFEPHRIPRTKAVEEFFACVAHRFSNFDPEIFFQK